MPPRPTPDANSLFDPHDERMSQPYLSSGRRNSALDDALGREQWDDEACIELTECSDPLAELSKPTGQGEACDSDAEIAALLQKEWNAKERKAAAAKVAAHRRKKALKAELTGRELEDQRQADKALQQCWLGTIFIGFLLFAFFVWRGV